MFNIPPELRHLRPPAAMVVAVLLSLGLSIAAGLAALTAAPPSGGRGIVVALGFALAVAAFAIALQWWLIDVSKPADWLVTVPWVAVPVLLLGCVLLADGRPATVPGWIGIGVQALVVCGLSFVLILFGALQSMLVRAVFFDGAPDVYQLSVGGLIAGPIIGAVAMLGIRRRSVRSGRSAAFSGEG
jgi:hypothetical protein